MTVKLPLELPRSERRRSLRILLMTIAGCIALGLLTRWGISAVRTARLAAQRSSCNCNLKQIGLALHNYHDTYGSFPPAYVADADGRPMHSWRVLILPFVDCNDLYKEYNFSEPWDSPDNLRLLSRRPKVFDCPSRDEQSNSSNPVVAAMGLLACTGGAMRPGISTSYAAAVGPDCVFRGSEPVTRGEISDGESNTLVIGEVSGAQIPWTKPEDIDIRLHSQIGDELGFSHGVEDGYEVYFLKADGAIGRLNTSTSQQTVDALFTRNGGEQIVDEG